MENLLSIMLFFQEIFWYLEESEAAAYLLAEVGMLDSRKKKSGVKFFLTCQVPVIFTYLPLCTLRINLPSSMPMFITLLLLMARLL